MVTDKAKNRRPPQRGRALVAMLLLMAVAIVGFVTWLRTQKRSTPTIVPAAESNPFGPVDATAFVGDRACAECHPGESAAHQGSGHSHTLTKGDKSPWARKLDGRSFADPERAGVTWTIHGGPGKFEIERAAEGKSQSTPVEYVFGSGTHGLTFLTTLPGATPKSDLRALEHRISYYAPGDRLGITTGQDKTADAVTSPGRTVFSGLGRELEEGTARRCFDCHATLTSSRGYRHFDTESLIANVTCERCHGPAREHVATAKRGETPAPLSFGYEGVGVDAEVRLCGTCHRYLKEMPVMSLNPDNLALVRFQPVGLMISKCYKAAMTGLRCSTCHDPHGRPTTDVAFYESKCAECHHQGANRLCSVSPRPKDGCLGCHMPKRKIPEGFTFTDHWIRKPNDRSRPGTPLPAPATPGDIETVQPSSK